MMAEQPTFHSDYSWLVVLLGAAAVVVAVSLFWALWRRNARVAAAIATAFAVAVALGVIVYVRTDQTATMQRAEAEARMNDLQQEMLARQTRDNAERQRLTAEAQDDRLPDDRYGRELAPAAVSPTELSAAWLPEVDENFEADVYPSATLAGRALIREWFGHFANLLSKGAEKPTRFRLTCRNSSTAVDVLATLEAMDEEVQKLFPEAATLVTTSSEREESSEPKADEITIELSVAQSVKRKRDTGSTSGRDASFDFSGVLAVEFNGQAWQLRLGARFIEKPWLTATSEFLSLKHRSTYLVLRSSQLAASADVASRDVLGQAADRLGDLVDPRKNQGLPRPASLVMLEQLEAGKYIADRFVQRLKRPYGDVYREAILVDIGSTNLRDMIQLTRNEVNEYDIATRRRTTVQVSTGLGVVVVIGSLTALYLLLNWLTKGYYRGPLTVLACLLGSGAVVGIILVIGMLA